MKAMGPADIFREWYNSYWRPWFPEDFKWRQFRFMTFKGVWIKIPRPKRRVRSKTKLASIIRSIAPRHAFYTALKFLDPSMLGPREVPAYCLGGDLVFDIDVLSDPTRIAMDQYKIAANYVLQLIDVLRELGYEDFFIVFTGFKGFHLHVPNFDPYEFLGILPSEVSRAEAEIRARKRITELITSKNIPIDQEVTRDIKRIVRLPGTLHGRTGLLALILDNAQINKVREDPLYLEQMAIPSWFWENVKIHIISPKVGRVLLFDEAYEMSEGSTSVPLIVALIIGLNNLVERLEILLS